MPPSSRVVSVTAGAGATATTATATTASTAVMIDGNPTNEVTALQQGANAVTEFADDTVSLFRTVNQSEADDILLNNVFRPQLGSIEGKFFWETLESADNYMSKFPEYARIIKIQVSQSIKLTGKAFENSDRNAAAVYFGREILQIFYDNIINIFLR